MSKEEIKRVKRYLGEPKFGKAGIDESEGK